MTRRAAKVEHAAAALRLRGGHSLKKLCALPGQQNNSSSLRSSAVMKPARETRRLASEDQRKLSLPPSSVKLSQERPDLGPAVLADCGECPDRAHCGSAKFVLRAQAARKPAASLRNHCCIAEGNAVTQAACSKSEAPPYGLSCLLNF